MGEPLVVVTKTWEEHKRGQEALMGFVIGVFFFIIAVAFLTYLVNSLGLFDFFTSLVIAIILYFLIKILIKYRKRIFGVRKRGLSRVTRRTSGKKNQGRRAMGYTNYQRRKRKRRFVEGKMYACRNCGYHQGLSFDGRMRRCKGCGSFNWG